MMKSFAAAVLALAVSAAAISSPMAQDKDEGRFPMGMMGGGRNVSTTLRQPVSEFKLECHPSIPAFGLAG